jgi:hypothetical protein
MVHLSTLSFIGLDTRSASALISAFNDTVAIYLWPHSTNTGNLRVKEEQRLYCYCFVP